MSGLFTTLSSVAHALDAQRYGLEVAGQNIANLNTEGYARRRLELAERPVKSGLGGVEILGVRTTRDAFIDSRLRSELPAQSQLDARSSALSIVETSLGDEGAALSESMSALFASFSSLSVDPQSSVARDGVLLQAKRVGNAFNELDRRLEASYRQADADVRGSFGEVNQLSKRIAELNRQIGDSAGGDTSGLTDQLNLALESLAKLTRISVITQPEGTVDVSIGAGRAVVVGANSYELTATAAPGTGLAELRIGGVDITDELEDGSIGGLLQVRDEDIPAYRTQLDQLAYDLTDAVNTLHTSGYDRNGAAGANFFNPLTGVSGAAAAIGVNPTVANDSSKVAASSTSTGGDNGIAKALAALTTAKVAVNGTSTLTEGWSVLVNRVGTDTANAKNDLKTREEVVNAITRLRDSVSGVSLDEEAGKLLQFQRAYEANARFFTAIDSTISTLLATFGAAR